MAAADEIQRIRVVNRNDFAIHDRFDGVPVVFEPNKQVDLSPEVAEHIFRYPGDTEDMYRHMARRWGWNLPKHIAEDEHGVSLWVRQCRNIEISVSRFELRPIGDPKAPIPADDGGKDEERVANEVPHANQGRRAKLQRKRQISKARSDRMKRIWAEKRARDAALREPPIAPTVGEQRPDGTAPRVVEGAS